jgi:hypothetical protein
MPILSKESDIFPEDLFEMPAAEAPWEIAHLRSRQEKSVARLLLDARKPFYLPQIQQTKKSGGRTFVSHLPLFPGYIFLRRVDGLRETLWRTSAVANMLEVPDQAQLDAELLQIRQLQQSGAALTPACDLSPAMRSASRKAPSAVTRNRSPGARNDSAHRVRVGPQEVGRRRVSRRALAQVKPGQADVARRRTNLTRNPESLSPIDFDAHEPDVCPDARLPHAKLTPFRAEHCFRQIVLVTRRAFHL